MNYIGNEPAPGGLILVGDTNPVGSIVWGHKVPDGSYLQMNGQVVSKVTYVDLWTYAQGFLTADQVANPGLYKSIDANTFALPKLDGLFIRSLGSFDAARTSAALGVRQDDLFKTHTHLQDASTNLFIGGGTGDGGSPVRITGGTTQATGGVETRPTNVALVPSVKALTTVLMPSTALTEFPLRSKALTATLNMASASAVVPYAGVGFQPSALIVGAANSTGNATYLGIVDAARQAMSIYQTATADSPGFNAAAIRIGASAADFMTGVVNSYDADGFTISWTRNGAPGGIVNLQFLALR